MNIKFDDARLERRAHVVFDALSLRAPIVASPEPEAPPVPDKPQTRPEREAPRYPTHTPPTPEKHPHPVEPLPDDEPYPACFGPRPPRF